MFALSVLDFGCKDTKFPRLSEHFFPIFFIPESKRISFFFFFHTNFHEFLRSVLLVATLCKSDHRSSGCSGASRSPINYAAQGIHDKLHGNSCLKTTPPGHLSMSRRILCGGMCRCYGLLLLNISISASKYAMASFMYGWIRGTMMAMKFSMPSSSTTAVLMT